MPLSMEHASTSSSLLAVFEDSSVNTAFDLVVHNTTFFFTKSHDHTLGCVIYTML